MPVWVLWCLLLLLLLLLCLGGPEYWDRLIIILFVKGEYVLMIHGDLNLQHSTL